MSDSDSLGSLLDSSSDDDELLVNINNKVKEDAAVPQRVVVPLPNPARNVASATAKDENGGFNAKEREWILKNFYFKKDDKKFYCDACSLGFNLANTPLDKCDASFTGGNASRKYRHIRNDHGVTPEMLHNKYTISTYKLGKKNVPTTRYPPKSYAKKGPRPTFFTPQKRTQSTYVRDPPKKSRSVRSVGRVGALRYA